MAGEWMPWTEPLEEPRGGARALLPPSAPKEPLMSSLRETLLVGGIVVSLVVLGCRPHGPGGEPASATVVAPQPTTTYHVRDESGRMVAVTIPAMGRQDIKVSNPTEGTVPATVTALNASQSQAQVQTQQGQRLV